MWKRLGIPIVMCLLASCQPVRPPLAGPSALRLEPLPVQQAKAYPETVTGMFVSLADFEDGPGGRTGRGQLANFAIEPALGAADANYVVNITRTGAGAMEVTLPPRCELVFKEPSVHNFSGYTLVSMALYSPALRDDLRVTLVSAAGVWISPRTLVGPGWNNVLIDIRRLDAADKFDAKAVGAIKLAFVDSASPVTFVIDDIMLINNQRTITPTPNGLSLTKIGLDYRLVMPGRSDPLAISQDSDSLWKLGADQALVRMAASGKSLPAHPNESIGIMGEHRVGVVELLENNDIRVRLASAWYFPSRQGEWASMAVRQIRWEYTFYSDGRCVVNLFINNAGGTTIGPLEILLNRPAAWAGGEVGRAFTAGEFPGGVGRWNYLLAPAGQDQAVHEQAFLKVGKIVATLAGPVAVLPGDLDRDGFDESQGCYYLAAKDGQCRFTLQPPAGGVINPVFRITGRWDGPISINIEGLSVQHMARLDDGSVLFALPGKITRPTTIEVFGKEASPARQ